jgi:hypothetical protein
MKPIALTPWQRLLFAAFVAVAAIAAFANVFGQG